MVRRANIAISVTEPNQLDLLSTISAFVNITELRADLLARPELARNFTSTLLVYVLRSTEEGGNFKDYSKRPQQLIKASTIFDFVELEGERDLIPEILNAIPAKKRRITWYGAAESFDELMNRAKRYLETPAACYKLITTAQNSEDAIPVVRLLNSIKDKPLVAYSVGSDTAWTQISAPFMGAPEIHATFESDDESDPSFTVSTLINDYGLPVVFPIKKLFGIIGNPVYGSVSPNRHNAAYRSMGLPYLYLPFQTECFSTFFKNVVNSYSLPISISGLTVVAPFKAIAYTSADESTRNGNDAVIKACNGMLRTENGWSRFSSDAIGAIQALNGTLESWSKKRIAIVGCGGAGSSIAEEMKNRNIEPTLVNRTIEKGLKVALDLDLPFVSLNDFSPEKYDVIIHCTPIGKTDQKAPFDVTKMKKECVVIDHVYSQQSKTPLVEYCHLLDMRVIDGVQMANIQIKQQFLSMLDLPMPIVKRVEHNKKTKLNVNS